MIPTLYKADTQDFSTNGIASLVDAFTVRVTEGLNGVYELYMEYPANGLWTAEIQDFRIIRAKPNDEDELHNFTIYDIVQDYEADRIFVYATTSTNKLGNNLVTSVTHGGNPQTIFNLMKNRLVEPTDMNFVSDITTVSSVNWIRRNPLNCIVGEEGSLVQIFGGEVKRTDDTIYLYSRRGRDKVMTVRQGRHVSGYRRSVSTNGIVTRILPYFTHFPEGSEDPVTVEGTIVNSPLVNNYPVRSIVPIDYSNDPDVTDLASLNNRAKSYFTIQNPDADKPKVNIEVNLTQVSESSEYSKFKKLEQVRLADTIDVWVPKFNVDVTVKVTELEYDSLLERTIRIKAGSPSGSFYDNVKNTYKQDISQIRKYVSGVENGLKNVIQASSDGMNKIFRGYTEPPAGLAKVNDLWFKPNGSGEWTVYIFDGLDWQPIIYESMGAETRAAVEEALREAEEARRQAKLDTEQALVDAKAHADAEVGRIDTELRSEISGAIDLAEQAKADAVTKANQALKDAKAHAESEDTRIKQEIGLEVNGAIEIAEQAKQDAIDKANQALVDAKTHADSGIQASKESFDEQFVIIGDEIDEAQRSADTANQQINDAVTNAGFSSLTDLTLDLQTIGNQADANAKTALSRAADAKNLANDSIITAQDASSLAETLSGKVSGFELTVGGFNQTVNNYTDQVAQFTSDVNGLNSTVSNYRSDVQGYSAQVSTFNNTLNGLNNTVSNYQSDVQGYSTQVSQFKNTLSGLNSTVSGYQSDVKGYQSQVSTFTNTVNGFNATVQRVEADYSGLSGTVQNLGSSIGVVEGQITNKVWKTDIQSAVDDIEFGGRNLLKGTTDEWIEMSASANSYQSMLNDFSKIPVEEIGLSVGEDFVAHIKVKNIDEPIRFRIEFWNSSSDRTSLYSQTLDPTNDIVQAEIKGVFLSGYSFLRFQFSPTGHTRAFNYSYSELKLEKGNKATDWTPAPEDATVLINHVESELTQKYDSITATVSSVDGRVATNKLNLDGLTTTVQSVRTDLTGTTTLLNTTRTTVSGHTSSISTLRTDVNGKATTAQFNTLTSTVNGTITRVGNAEGRLTTVETNVDGLQSTVASKASQTQVTQLATGLSAVVSQTDQISEWSRSYTVNTANPKQLVDINGSQLSKSYSYEITLGIPSTGTVTNFIASLTSNSATSGWTLTIHERSGTSSNHPYVYLDSSGNPMVSLYSHTSYYTVVATVKQLASRSKTSLTMLSDNINLRVSKGDVVSQINIEAGRTLIQSDKLVLDSSSVVFTGSAFIPSAQIQSLHADKITAGTISSSRINASEIVTQGLTANVVKSTHLETSTATVDKLFATTAMVNRLTAKTAFIASIKAVDIDASKITSGTISAARINAVDIVTKGLTADVVKSTHIETSTATVDKLFATDIMVNRLTAKSAFITSIKAVTIDASKITSGTISAARINASAVVTAGLTANVVKSTHLETSTATIDKLFATTASIDRLTGKSAFIASIKAIEISADKITTGTLFGNSVTATGINVSTIVGNVSNFVTSNWNSNGSDVRITSGGILTTASDGSQTYIQNGIVGTRNPSGATVGQLGYVYNGGSPTYTLGISQGSNFLIRGRPTGTDINLFEIYPGSSETYIRTTQTRILGEMFINGRIWLQTTDDLRLSGGNIVNPYGIYFTNGGEIYSTASTSLWRFDHVNGGIMQFRIGGTQKFRIDATRNYMNQILNMQGNQIVETSDARLKTNIRPTTDDTLSKLTQIEYVDYQRLENGQEEQGFIAQQVRMVAPELIQEEPDGMLTYGIQPYIHFIGRATQQLASATESELTKLKNKLKELEDEINKLRNQ